MFRASRRRLSSGFAQIPNAVLRDSELSARARGVLCHLLSHADGFEITRATLQDQFTEGRDAIDTALRELREAGYVRAIRTQGDSGRFTGAQYLVFDERGGAEADDELDGADNHGPGNPGYGEPETTARESRSPDNPQPHIRTPIPKNTKPQEHQENTTRTRVIESGFEGLWKVYPRKTGKRTAQQAFERAVRRLAGKGQPADGLQPAINTIVSGAAEFARATVEAGTELRFIPHPSTWLNGDRWADETGPVPGRELTAAEAMAAELQRGRESAWGGDSAGELVG